MSRGRLAVVAALTLAAPMVAAVPATAAKKPRTVRVTTTNIVITTVDLGPAGKSPGDMYVYDGDVTSKGRQIGRIYGANTSVKVEGQRETVSGQLTFKLGGGDSIVIGGLAEYPASDNSGLVLGNAYTRPVIGGTGRYAGVHGTDTAIRQPNGDYRHIFRFKR
jgi:hypothetical protein